MKTSIFLFLTFIASQLFAQDLIVKTTGDSLNCMITQNENSYMYFNQIINHRFKRDSLALADIRTFKMGYFNTTKKEEPNTSPTTTAPKPITIQPHNTIKPTTNSTYKSPRNTFYNKERNFFIAFSGGISNQIASLPNGLDPFMKKFYKNLLNGGVWGVEAAYFINENVGFGLQYSNHISNSSIENASILVDSINNVYEYGTYLVKIRIHFIAPTLYIRTISDNEKSVFMGKLAIGNTTFSQVETLNKLYFSKSGNNLSVTVGSSYMYKIDPKISIGISADYHIAEIKSVTYFDGTNSATSSLFPENVRRYDIKLMLAYWF